MCEKRYDLDCLDSIETILQRRKNLSTSWCGDEQKQLEALSNDNNNTQLLSPNQQQNKQSQNLKNLQQLADGGKAVLKVKSESDNCNVITSSSANSLILTGSSTGINTTAFVGQMSSSPATATPTAEKPLIWRDRNLITCMLITANVGTIFEESTLLELWFEQLKSYLVKIKPQLVAIHCQEVGGKNFETSMKNVSSFTDKILGDDKIIGDYSRVRIFLDENYECLEKFTALGSLYLVHDSVDNVKLYNFRTAQYDLIEGRNVLAASDKRDLLESREDKQNHNGFAEHVEKIKFPQDLFPECRLSRKGFMRTRWLFNDCQPLDLVNIHLFHDASNLVAMKTTPSPYAQNRQRALEFALSKLSEPLRVAMDNNNRGQISQQQREVSNIIEETSESGCKQQAKDYDLEHSDHQQVPLFIFGDFNFRLNTSKVIQRITEGIAPVIKRNSKSDEVLEIVYHRKTSDCVKRPTACTECGKQKQQSSNDENNGNGEELPDQKEEDGEGGVVMTVGKKLFDFRNLDETFRATKNTEWLLELDNELDSFKSQLYEFKISFSPSYPFKEDETGGYSYMKTRCPAWCDRILFNEAGYRLISDVEASEQQKGESHSTSDGDKRIEVLQDRGDVIYRLMGNSVPMGDHKPVLLYCHLDISKQPNQRSRHQLQNPSRTKCNQTVTTTPKASPEDHLVESTAI